MHNHPPRCCCTTTGAPILAPHRCPSCPDHGHLATLTKTREEIAAGLANYATRPAPDLVGKLRESIDAARNRRLNQKRNTE